MENNNCHQLPLTIDYDYEGCSNEDQCPETPDHLCNVDTDHKCKKVATSQVGWVDTIQIITKKCEVSILDINHKCLLK